MNNVIVVEDDPIQIRILKMTLSQYYDVKIYAHPQDLLDNLSTIDADIFLLDLALPGMDGFSLGQEIRAVERFAQTPMIAVSADVSIHTRAKCKELMFTDFVEKPVLSENFVNIINSYLLPAR